MFIFYNFVRIYLIEKERFFVILVVIYLEIDYVVLYWMIVNYDVMEFDVMELSSVFYFVI